MYTEHFQWYFFQRIGDQTIDPNSRWNLTRENNNVFKALMLLKLLVLLLINLNNLKAFWMKVLMYMEKSILQRKTISRSLTGVTRLSIKFSYL